MPSKKQRAKAKKAAAAAAPNDKQPKLEGPQTLKQAFRAAHRQALKDRPKDTNPRWSARCKKTLDNIDYSDESRESGSLLRERLRTKLEERVATVDDEADPYSGYITQDDEVLAD